MNTDSAILFEIIYTEATLFRNNYISRFWKT